MTELAMTFLSNPWNIWKSGDYHMRRMVLKLAFSARIPYDQETGFLNPKKVLSVQTLRRKNMDKLQMVPLIGFEPTTHALRMRCSTPELQRHITGFTDLL